MKVPKLFKGKEKRNKVLLEEYERGKILQVDKDIDNRKFLREK